MTLPAPPTVRADRISSLPGRLRSQAAARPVEAAIREKRLGRWNEISWAQYYANVRLTARAFLQLGVDRDDHVAILSENRQEWLYADLAAQAIGARSVGIYPTCPAAEVAYQLRHSGAKVLVAEDQEQVDKAVECAQDTPSVRHLVVIDPRGTRSYEDDRLVTWEDLWRLGASEPDLDQEVERRLVGLDPDAPAMVVYTSGTTGTPKGALLTHRNVTTSADISAEQMGWSQQDSVLSYLPLCHVAEKIFTEYLPLTMGSVVHFGESIDTVQQDLQDVSPTVFLGVPRIWEKIFATVDIRLQDTSPFKRWLARALLPPTEARQGADRDAPKAGPRARVADVVLHRPLRERLGLQRCRLPMAGGAPIDPGLLRWFHGIGVRILEGYGQTETAGITHMNVAGQGANIGTVGLPLRGVETHIGDDGEILIRHDGIIFPGYLHDDAATAEAVRDGWLHTGDIGRIDDDGCLRITGRKKEIIITAGGKNLSPARIENLLKASPYIKEAIAIGDRRKYVSALVQIEYDRVADWAARRGIAHSSFRDLATNPEVEKLVAREVDAANKQLARVESVRVFRLLDKELHQDDEELTATQKVRREIVHERFAALIEGMYRP